MCIIWTNNIPLHGQTRSFTINRGKNSEKNKPDRKRTENLPKWIINGPETNQNGLEMGVQLEMLENQVELTTFSISITLISDYQK